MNTYKITYIKNKTEKTMMIKANTKEDANNQFDTTDEAWPCIVCSVELIKP